MAVQKTMQDSRQFEPLEMTIAWLLQLSVQHIVNKNRYNGKFRHVTKKPGL